MHYQRGVIQACIPLVATATDFKLGYRWLKAKLDTTMVVLVYLYAAIALCYIRPTILRNSELRIDSYTKLSQHNLGDNNLEASSVCWLIVIAMVESTYVNS